MRLRLTAVVCLALAVAAPVAAQRPGSEVLTRDDLRALGIHRLSDLVQWISRAVVSVEGLAWNAVLDPVASPHWDRTGGAGWVLLVDEQPVNASQLGGFFPELLPVGLPQIDSVTVVRGPSVAGGELTGGAIHIHTGAPTQLDVGGWTRYGAESGDPGPYLYTPRATPNVDRTGPDNVVWAGFGTAGWGVRAVGRFLRTDVSDPRLRERFPGEYSPFTQQRGGSLHASGEFGGGRHYLNAGHYFQWGHVYLAEPQNFMRPDLTTDHLGASGEWRLPGGLAARYRAAYSSFLAVVPGLVPARNHERRTTGSVEVGGRRGSWDLRGGIGLDDHDLRPLSELSERVRPGGVRLFAAAVRRLASGDSATYPETGWLRFEGGVATGEGELGQLLGAAVSRPLSQRVSWDASADWLRHPGEPKSGSVLRVGSGVTAASGPARLRIGALAGSRGGAARPTTMDDEPPQDLLPGDDPRYLSIHADAGLRYSSRLSAGFFHEATWSSRSSSSLVPTHVTRARLQYRVAPSFRISASAQARSSISFDPPIGPTELAPFLRLDVAAEKDLWNHRAHLQMVVRNLLDAPETHHPDGARFGLRYFATASVVLP